MLIKKIPSPNVIKSDDLAAIKVIKNHTPPKIVATPTVTALSALLLASCASNTDLHDMPVAEIRSKAESDLNNAIFHTNRQKELLAEIQAASGGTHNRYLPATETVPTVNDIRPIDEQSMLSIVNEGQDSRNTIPSLPSTEYEAYEKQKAQQIALQQQQLAAQATWDNKQSENYPDIHAPALPAVDDTVANNAVGTQNANDVYTPPTQYAPKEETPAAYSTRQAVDLNSRISKWQGYQSAIGVNPPPKTNHVELPPTNTRKTALSSTRREVNLGTQAATAKPAVPQAQILVSPNLRPFMAQVSPPNGNVRVSEAVKMISKASGYEFAIIGEDKPYVVQFDNFKGSLMDLLKLLGEGLGDKGVISVQPKQQKITLQYK